MSEQPDLNALWSQTKQVILGEMTTFNRSLWDAANAAQPLVLEGDTFVLGMPPGQMALGSHLTSTANAPLVRRALERTMGRPMSLEIIEGTDASSWEREKERREARVRLAERQAALRRATETAHAVWQELYEQVGSIFGATRDRRYPTSRAAMMAKALLATREAEVRALEQDPESAELHQQQLNRTLERIATLAEVPGTVAAIEYLRVKSRKQD
ncbi:MAG: hypothetical protein AB7Y46_13595 [Armatimonadota bacterium]